MVIDHKGGALKKILRPIKLGLGSPLATGKQYVPWIHIDDLCRMFLYCIENDISGTYNAANGYISNRELMKTITKKMKKPLILIADDDDAIRLVLEKKFSRSGFTTKSTNKGKTLLSWIESGEGDLIITDVIMEDSNGLDLLPLIQDIRPDLPVLVMSGLNTIKTAIDASAGGAYEYFPKPFDLDKVLSVVVNAFNSENRVIKQQDPGNILDDDLPIIGRSAAMQEVYRILAKVVKSDLTVMIRGESGTGKELVAHNIHEKSTRSKGTFIEVNCAAIPSELIESELFGHLKGSFTSAVKDRQGKFEAANNGTLFLDEIGDMSLAAQAKVLRALEESKIQRVGSQRDISVDVRVIAATNKDLKKEIENGNFREDLYHRLAVIMIEVPELSKRKSDIPILVSHFSKLISQEQGIETKEFNPDSLKLLENYEWSGNIRELRNVIERLIILGGNPISKDDVNLFASKK